MTTLPNGLRVYTDPMPSLETAAIGVWAGVGSVDEHESEHGIAHLLEHMAFKGTTTRSARMLAEEIEAVGGYMNAATSHQRTGYYVRLLKDDVALGVDILSDILLNPLFDEHELQKEKEVIVQEIGEAADTPDDVVFEMLQSISWGAHPLARPILGTPSSVRSQTPDNLRRFMRRGYRAGDLVVAAAGKIDPDAFVMQVEKAFEGVETGAKDAASSAPIFQGGSQQDSRDIEQTHIAIAFPGVSSADDDFYASRVFADALGGGMSSRLFQRIREEAGLAYSVYAFSDSYDHCGLVGAYAGADAQEAPAIVAAIAEEMAKMTIETTDEELARTKAMLRASLMMGLENPAARIEGAAGQIFRYGAVTAPKEISARIDAVGPDDIRRCAERALGGPCAIAMVGPGNLEKTANSLSV
ncbi:MAG: pitrilysin family protein [Pseudomonadota bacterium]